MENASAKPLPFPKARERGNSSKFRAFREERLIAGMYGNIYILEEYIYFHDGGEG